MDTKQHQAAEAARLALTLGDFEDQFAAIADYVSIQIDIAERATNGLDRADAEKILRMAFLCKDAVAPITRAFDREAFAAHWVAEHRPAPELPPFIAPAVPPPSKRLSDRIHSAIALHKHDLATARRMLNEMGEIEDDAVIEAMADRISTADERLAGAVPTTLAGIAALSGYVLGSGVDVLRDERLRNLVLANIASAAASLAGVTDTAAA